MYNSSNLVPFVDDNGLEVVINTSTGASYAPGYRALARICSIGLEIPIHPEKVKRYVSSLLKAVTDCDVIEAEIETIGGKQGVTLIPEKLVARSIRKFNDLLSDKVFDSGTRVFMHGLAGYKIHSTATERTKSRAELHLESAKLLLEHEQRLEALEKAEAERKQREKEARLELQQLPDATVAAAPLTTQFALVRLVRG